MIRQLADWFAFQWLTPTLAITDVLQLLKSILCSLDISYKLNTNSTSTLGYLY